jgi:hypothetical protein
MLQRLRDAMARLALLLQSGGTGGIHIKVDSPARLVIEAGWLWTTRSHTFDATRRVVLRNGRVLARFNQLHSVDVRAVHDRYGAVTGYAIALHRGWLDNLHLGSTSDDAEASIVAARISTITGLKVLSMTPPWSRRG